MPFPCISQGFVNEGDNRFYMNLFPHKKEHFPCISSGICERGRHLILYEVICGMMQCLAKLLYSSENSHV